MEHITKLTRINYHRQQHLTVFLREYLHLTGTKRMCLEGGCGTCVVAVKRKNIVTEEDETVAVNSCLVSIFSTYGWEIYTIEGLGTYDCPSNLQSVITKFHGTQCGYCTPGMIMNMHALKETKQDLTMEEVENSFGGNICRCTGYRSILAAFKSVCKDASQDLLNKCGDIEDLPTCPKKIRNGNCSLNTNKPFYYKLDGPSWIKVTTVNELLQVIKAFHPVKNGNVNSYMIVAGNTARGVYKRATTYNVYVDIQDVSELKNHLLLKTGLVIGANMTLSRVIMLFNELSEQKPKLRYLKKVAEHIDLVANVPVRNIGTLAGNLMIKHEYKEFPSDIFLVLETVNAVIQIVDLNEKETSVTPVEFLKTDMENKIIRKIFLPFLTESHFFDSFKIMRRAQNTHASINAAFLLKLSEQHTVDECNIVMGCLDSKIHATDAEKYLIGKKIFTNEVMQQAFKILGEELAPGYDLINPKSQFIKKCAISLFYKYILSIAPKEILSAKIYTGRYKLKRPVSKGTQIYESIKEMYPLSYPVAKKEALHQTTGEAEYISDMPDLPGQLYAAFVVAKTEPLSRILKIHKEKALEHDGVIAFFDKTDIPGRNTFTPLGSNLFPTDPVEEELFCSGVVQYHFQPIGVVVATSRELAEKAADLIEVDYQKEGQPEFETREILRKNKMNRVKQDMVHQAKYRGRDVAKVVKGTWDMGWQSHFYMETQCCNVVYKENGLDIWSSTQWMDLNQFAASVVLNIPSNMINVHVKRVGGAFGGKITRNAQISTAAALAAVKIKKPVKMWLPLEQNFAIVGKRHAISSDYEIAIGKDGKIQYLNNDFYVNHGLGGNEDVIPLTLEIMQEGPYNGDIFNINAKTVRSDMQSAAYVRGPGSVEGLGMLESILDHGASVINMDPLEFRIKNLTDRKIIEYMNDFLEWADIRKRKQEIYEFNEKNLWNKKGMSVVPMVFAVELYNNYGVMVTIYHADGSVAISHGGVEIGQGVNTKAIQACAYKLGIPMEKISVKPSNNVIGANSGATGNSLTSEGICWGVGKACDILLERMKPIKEKLKDPKWEDLVTESHKNSINLVAQSMYSPVCPDLNRYKVYAVCAAEIELDVLTGLHQVTRVDILEDVGDSMNPEIDIGQIEGAFVMGMGYFTTEKVVVGENGEILSNRTWNYTPPGAKDIPIDFRIKLPGKNPNPVGVLKSKAVGEPALCLAVTVPLAIRNAASTVRTYFDKSSSSWYPINGPSDVENTFINCSHNYQMYTL